jgi:hypothetical protein
LLFFVELGVAMIVASPMVPRRGKPTTCRCVLTVSKIVC